MDEQESRSLKECLRLARGYREQMERSNIVSTAMRYYRLSEKYYDLARRLLDPDSPLEKRIDRFTNKRRQS